MNSVEPVVGVEEEVEDEEDEEEGVVGLKGLTAGRMGFYSCFIEPDKCHDYHVNKSNFMELESCY